jgi:16S rRNA C967 or C1407 C5-methylase (RsmB/RsmF family)
MTVIQQDFDSYYSSIFGDRWPALKVAMQVKEKQVRRYNLFLQNQPAEELAQLGWSDHEILDWLPSSAWHEAGDVIPRSSLDLLAYYVLDPASVLVAENLSVQPGEKVLDLCAAPGGKSLVLAQSLFALPNSKSELVLNELSPDRRERLKKVVQQYIPRDVRDQVWIKGKDGTRFGLEVQNHFDAILLDAPCSGERHLLENEKELRQWKEQRTKGLAQKQYNLLCSAWLALKPGGRLMYSTCSISPLENDGVIDRFFKKKTGVELGAIHRLGPGAERTENGVLYLPDQCGFGPMYSCLLIKTN